MKKENTTSKNFFEPAELKGLVLAAQAHDQNAIDSLCEAFRPLIMKEAHLSYIQNKLGEEAENTAWQIFLEFIMSYEDDDYAMLPGLLKVRLHFAFFHLVYRKKEIIMHLLLDETDDDGNKIYNPACSDTFTERLELRSELNYALGILSKKQRDIIRATVLGDMDLNTYSKNKNISYTAAYKLQKKALAVLKCALDC